MEANKVIVKTFKIVFFKEIALWNFRKGRTAHPEKYIYISNAKWERTYVVYLVWVIEGGDRKKKAEESRKREKDNGNLFYLSSTLFQK